MTQLVVTDAWHAPAPLGLVALILALTFLAVCIALRALWRVSVLERARESIGYEAVMAQRRATAESRYDSLDGAPGRWTGIAPAPAYARPDPPIDESIPTSASMPKPEAGDVDQFEIDTEPDPRLRTARG